MRFFRILYEHIERFFYWGWKLKGSHDWDYSFFYEIMYLKLNRMYNCFRDYGNCMGNSDINNTEMRKLRMAIELCNRLKDDKYRNVKISNYYRKYFFTLLEKHLNKWWD